MTDRKLLELAAKAAGIDRGADRLEYGILVTEKTGRRSLPKWNPLEDDGDAFRLAVKLRINVTHGANMVNAEREQPEEVAAVEPFNGDPAAATRRAIVKAAAEIGSRW